MTIVRPVLGTTSWTDFVVDSAVFHRVTEAVALLALERDVVGLCRFASEETKADAETSLKESISVLFVLADDLHCHRGLSGRHCVSWSCDSFELSDLDAVVAESLSKFIFIEFQVDVLHEADTLHLDDLSNGGWHED